MPRKSPYEIILSKDEAQKLSRRAAQSTLPYFMVIRAKMILLAAQGLSNDEIADQLHTRREIARPPRAANGLFPPDLIIQVKALACELPATCHLPLARWSVAELSLQVRQSGLIATISDNTIWRWPSPAIPLIRQRPCRDEGGT
jgi:hypothetical protein